MIKPFSKMVWFSTVHEREGYDWPGKLDCKYTKTEANFV